MAGDKLLKLRSVVLIFSLMYTFITLYCRLTLYLLLFIKFPDAFFHVFFIMVCFRLLLMVFKPNFQQTLLPFCVKLDILCLLSFFHFFFVPHMMDWCNDLFIFARHTNFQEVCKLSFICWWPYNDNRKVKSIHLFDGIAVKVIHTRHK